MPIGGLKELLVAVIIAAIHTGSEEVPSQSRNFVKYLLYLSNSNELWTAFLFRCIQSPITYIQIVSGTDPFMATINRRNNYSDQERFSQRWAM